MRKNKFFIAGLVTVFVALVSLTLVSSTWAKYTSTVSGEDSARVAKWEWVLNENNNLASTVTVDLFKTIKDSDGSSAETDVDTSVQLIAPGTSGEFTLDLKNLSEVNAVYSVDYTISNTASLPVQFSIDGTNWTSDLADVVNEPIAMKTGTDSIKIQWKWVFDGNDHTDTQFGIEGTDQLVVSIKVTMTQVD